MGGEVRGPTEENARKAIGSGGDGAFLMSTCMPNLLEVVMVLLNLSLSLT